MKPWRLNGNSPCGNFGRFLPRSTIGFIVVIVLTLAFVEYSWKTVEISKGVLSDGIFVGRSSNRHRVFYYNQSRQNVALFVLVNVSSNDSVISDRLQNRELGLGNCESSDGAVVGYRLYIVYYGAGEPAARTENRRLFSLFVTERARLASLRGCQVTVASQIDAVDHGGDIRALNEAMISAHLDDDVDYFHVILPEAAPSYINKARRVGTLIKLLRHFTDPFETGIIIEMQSLADNRRPIPFEPLAVFFSRTHFDIFGLFFPLNVPDVRSAVSLVADAYYSKHGSYSLVVMVTSNSGSRGFSLSKPNNITSFARQRWPDSFNEQAETLQRYLSAVNSSSCFRCPTTSKSGLRVISMSLYGSSRRYTMGAIRNAQLAPVTYPGWRLRFYTELPGKQAPRHGAVPAGVLARLRQLGAEIYDVPESSRSLAPMLWRFTALDDPNVDIFIVRDCDSRLTPRDAAVVSDWLKQEPAKSVFHCIRDHPSHSGYSISGGLWGARRAAMSALFNGSFSAAMVKYGAGYIEDMNFLGRDVWPKVQPVAYCHDSFSCKSFAGSHPFPVKRIGSEHLGEVYDQFSVGRQGDINILMHAAVNADCVPH